MSDLFSLFQPGYEHTRRQKELDKVLVIDAKTASGGREPPDLDSGRITIHVTGGEPGEPAEVAGPDAGV